MSTGLTNTHTARGFSDLYHLFARKQCILCPALRDGCLTLPYVTSIRDFFCPWKNRGRLYQAAASKSREDARLLVGNYVANAPVNRCVPDWFANADYNNAREVYEERGRQIIRWRFFSGFNNSFDPQMTNKLRPRANVESKSRRIHLR